MAASRHKSLALLLCAGLVRDVFAQCVMPALEAGVEPGGATPCPAVGEDVLDTETCTVVCLVSRRPRAPTARAQESCAYLSMSSDAKFP